MIAVRRASERGHGQHSWLNTYHTFSFNDYYDPRHMGFRVLRVINEDRVEPGQGFGAHGHRDMEIISYVLDGALAHKDSLGNGSVLRPGEFQCITAGTGIRHSEFNPSDSEPVHFYQIWLLPDRPGLPPRYDQRTFPEEERRPAADGRLAGRAGRLPDHPPGFRGAPHLARRGRAGDARAGTEAACLAPGPAGVGPAQRGAPRDERRGRRERRILADRARDRAM